MFNSYILGADPSKDIQKRRAGSVGQVEKKVDYF